MILGLKLGHAGPLGSTGMLNSLQYPFSKLIQSLCIGNLNTTFQATTQLLSFTMTPLYGC